MVKSRIWMRRPCFPKKLQVMRYLDTSDLHVLYRVTPLFRENELVARGMEKEALSVEDEGKGLCFSRLYLQSAGGDIVIDYRTEDSWTEK